MTDAQKYEGAKALLMGVYKELAYAKSYPNDCPNQLLRIEKKVKEALEMIEVYDEETGRPFDENSTTRG
jgi:hypothetical protein